MRVNDERAGDGDPLFHAAGKFAGYFILGAFETDVLKLFRHDACDFRGRFKPVLTQVKPDVFANGQRVKQRAGLKNQRQPVFARDFRRLDGLAIDENFAGIGHFEPDKVFEQHAFTAAARPHDNKNFAGLDLEINAVEHRLPGKTFTQAAHLEADAGAVVVWRVHYCSRTRVST